MAEKKAEIISVENLSDGRHLIQARTGTTQWTMEQIGDDDPIFLSRGTARTLGYGRDRDMNKLITRLYATQTEQRATASRCSPADGEVFYRLLPNPRGGKPIKEYLLTRRQLAKLIMRSGTERAGEMQDDMIEVILEVRRRGAVGLTRAQLSEVLAEERKALLAEVASAAAEMVKASIVEATGTAIEAVKQAAALAGGRVVAEVKREIKAEGADLRSRIETTEEAVQKIIGHSAPWNELPRDKLAITEKLLALLLEQARKQAAAREQAQQADLPNT